MYSAVTCAELWVLARTCTASRCSRVRVRPGSSRPPAVLPRRSASLNSRKICRSGSNTCENKIARLQPHHLTHASDQLVDAEDHVARVGLLPQLAVDPQPDLLVHRVCDAGGGDVRADRAEGIVALGQCPRTAEPLGIRLERARVRSRATAYPAMYFDSSPSLMLAPGLLITTPSSTSGHSTSVYRLGER